MLRGPLAPRTLPSASSRTWTCGCWASRCGIWSTGISSTRQARGIYFGPPPPHTPKLIFFPSRDMQIFFCLYFPPFACILPFYFHFICTTSSLFGHISPIPLFILILFPNDMIISHIYIHPWGRAVTRRNLLTVQPARRYGPQGPGCVGMLSRNFFALMNLWLDWCYTIFVFKFCEWVFYIHHLFLVVKVGEMQVNVCVI
jgi:hypothetical protein